MPSVRTAVPSICAIASPVMEPSSWRPGGVDKEPGHGLRVDHDEGAEIGIGLGQDGLEQ